MKYWSWYFISKSIHSILNANAYSDLSNELNQLKSIAKLVQNKNKLNFLLNTINSLSNCYYDEIKNLKFCLFKITELIKNNLIETYDQENIETLPKDYCFYE